MLLLAPTNIMTTAAGRVVLKEEKKDGVWSVTLIKFLPGLS